MTVLLRSFYREPVLALGVIQAVASSLAAYEVIPAAVGVTIVAVLVPFQRRFVRPQNRRLEPRP
jgi:hypothetical protein